MTSTAAARSLGITAAVTAGGLTALEYVAQGSPPPARIAFAALGAAVGLTALAGPLPGIAAGLSVVVIITAVLTAFDPSRRLGGALANLTT